MKQLSERCAWVPGLFCDTAVAQLSYTKGTCRGRKVKWDQNLVGPPHQAEEPSLGRPVQRAREKWNCSGVLVMGKQSRGSEETSSC